MPKRVTRKIKIPTEQPDCCAMCPLLGVIPKEERPFGSKETHVCIARQEALSGRGISVKASGRDSHHPLKRPCDEFWEVWTRLPGGYYPMKDEFYLRYRLPYEASQQMVIKFHRNNN